MRAPIYIGEELSATGYRLAGAEVIVSDAAADIEALIEDAARRTSLLLLGAGTAAALPAQRLHDLLREREPAVVVVPDIQGDTAPPDLAGWVRGQLGMNA